MPVIGFDARTLRTMKTGMGRVTQCLFNAMLGANSGHRYIVFQRSELNEPFIEHPDVEIVRVSYDIASLRNQLLFSSVLSKYRLDIYHSLHAFLPYWPNPGVKSVITIHDFNWLQRPALSAPKPWMGYVNHLYAKIAQRHSVNAADYIVCVSNQTQTDLRTLFPSAKFPTTVIHHGHTTFNRELNNVRSNVIDLLDRRFILSIGNGRPYKNPEGTIRAFTRIKSNPKNSDLRLIMVGRGDTEPQLKTLVRTEKLEQSVSFLGLVSDNELGLLMKKAVFLSFPSRWEGFGLPIIEAFASGCPVVASQAGSLPEICGDAALSLKNPESIDEISAAFNLVISDPSLREKLRNRGFERAKKFTWQQAAKRYLSVYDDVLHLR